MNWGNDSVGACTLEQYKSALTADGKLILPGASGTFWEGTDLRSLVLRPEFRLAAPSPAEVRRVLWQGWSPLVTYSVAPDPEHPQNAWLYVCQDQDYRLEKLDSPARRDIRRALRAFRFEFLDHATFLKHGEKCFCDTRRRNDLSDGIPEVFRDKFVHFDRNPAHRILGAWAYECLAAYVALIMVDDWVKIYPYAADDHLKGCPVNGIVHFTLEHYLVQRKFRLVNYGLSSVQEASKASGLHKFKKKLGFECLPVHRAVVFHPLLRPLANRGSLWALRACRALFPGNSPLRRAAGLLAAYLGKTPMPSNDRSELDATGYEARR